MDDAANTQVLICGPPAAKPFLDQVAKALGETRAAITITCDLARPADFPGWDQIEVLVVFALPCAANDLASARCLRAIVVPSLGIEGIDIEAARARGIAVANGRVTENFETVAEAAVLFMLMTLYDIHETERRLRRNESHSGPARARMLKGKTIGIIGFGNIAKALVQRLQGWGARILIHSRSSIENPFPQGEECDLTFLLAQSDVVVPLVPLTDETHHLLSRERLLAMKSGAILVNLSRGGIIDEASLTDPLVAAHLGPVALDVFENEPLGPGSPLRDLPDAVLTGHDIAHTQENLAALFNATMANIEGAIAGKTMPTALC